MNKLKCKIGLHKYQNIGTQYAKGIVGSFSMALLMRDVEKCKICGKINFVAYDIATNAHLDETIIWHPKLTY